jgi:glycosyltransferase involved in cell wall biosynthesis
MLEPYADIRVKVIAPKCKTEAFQDAKNVTVASNISDDDLRASYREASCLLTTLDAATANNAVLEAMACGVPIVSENIGGIAEYTGARCAMLCEAGSADALTQSILALYKNSNMVARMSSQARERAKELDWPLVAERTVRLYENLLTERHTKNII